MTTTLDPTQTATVRLRQWIARERELASRVVEVRVLRTTAKAIQVEGHASTGASNQCHRCGREIHEQVSRLLGYGPICCEKLGIPRDFDEEQVEELRRSIEQTTQFSAWLPRSAVDDIVVDGEHVPVHTFTVSGDGSKSSNGDAPTDDRKTVRIRVDDESDRILVDGDTWQIKDTLKALPGARWNKAAKCWTYPATVAAAAEIRANLSGVVRARSDSTFADLIRKADETHEAATHKTADDLPPIPKSATDAWNHQRQAFWFSKPLDSTMLAMDMGTGKSKVVVDLVVNRGDRRVLILCPNKVVGVWPREFRTHAGADVDVVALRQKPGRKTALSVARKAEMASEALDEHNNVDTPLVVVVNYDSAWREPLDAVLTSIEWDLVVLDESHKVKAPGGKASMFTGRLRKHAKRRLCLTGTPMPHSPLDVYAQFRFLDPGVFGTSFVRFRNRYAVMGGYGGHEVVGWQNEDELSERMHRTSFRVMADDVLDLPEYHHVPRHVTLDKSESVYRDLETSMYAEVDEGTITPANALVKLLRLQQVTGGHVVDDDGNETVVGSEKADTLREVLGELAVDEPVVVFCRFKADLDRVRDACENPTNGDEPRRYAEISGRQNDGLTDDSTMTPDADVVGVQIQAGGVGVDLTRARYAVFYSVGFSLGDYEQALKRIHRPGQDRATTFVHLVAEGTIDEKVYAALRKRKNVVEHVLGLADANEHDVEVGS